MSRDRGRIYTRERGGARRYYADFRDYADVGGGRETLCPSGRRRATSDRDEAEALAGARLKELQELRLRRVNGMPAPVGLAAFARDHLVKKAQAKRTTSRHLEHCERNLTRAVAFFGAEQQLAMLTVEDVGQWAAALQASGLSGGTVRHHLNALSNLFRRAIAEQAVPPGYNPVAAMLEKPSSRRAEARWLEVHEAALLLESARLYVAKRDDLAVPFAHALLATFLLTGGRRSEVLCLEVDDVSFDRRTVAFRPNTWRDTLGLRPEMKTDTSWRTVPLWPQLEQILRPYVFGDRPPARLLFPSFRTRDEAVLTDLRKLIDAVATRAGWKAAEITSKMFRHTYCAARLQTLDGGSPVSVYTVAKELGHGGETMVRRVYGHLGAVRHRATMVEYRVEQHRKALRERLAMLRAGTTPAPRGSLP